MANTLTNLIPTIYEAIDVTSRERVGFIPAVTKNASAERAALDQSIRVPIVPADTTTATNTPSITPPDLGDFTADSVEMKITKSKHFQVKFNGEELRGLGTAGTADALVRGRFEQAFRTLCNEVESDLAGLYVSASRAVGTAGTTPFNTANDIQDFANVMRILDDNGCPPDNLRLVLSNAAMQNLRAKQSVLFKANEAGTDELLRDGKVMRVMGFDIGQSGQVKTHTKGTLSGSPTLTSTDYAVGATSITLASAGAGTIVQGDFANIAGENNGIWYGVDTGDADVSGGGTIVLNKPGLRIAQTTNTSAISIAANYSANMAFHPTAMQLIARAPAMPDGGDVASDSTFVTDPISGLTFEVREYKGFAQSTYLVMLAWGVKAIKPEHMAVLFG